MTDKTVNGMYEIWDFNFPDFESYVKKLNKKIEKLGLKDAMVSYSVIGWHPVPADAAIYDRMLEVYVYADPIKVNGDWTFIARLRHDKATGAMVDVVPGRTLPEKYRTADSCNCDHCHVKRRRNDTFVFENTTTGETVQVGRQCLKDYFGHDVDSILKYADFVSSIGGRMTEYRSSTMQPKNFANILEYLAFVVRELKTGTWVSRANAMAWGKQATCELTWSDMLHWVYPNGKYHVDPPTAEELDFAAKVKTYWVELVEKKKAGNEQVSDFEHNLYTIMKEDAINGKDIGYAAASVMMYKKAMDDVRPKAGYDPTKCVHVGTVGDKIPQLSVTVLFTANYEGFYGNGRVVKMVGSDGNIYTTFGGVFKSEVVKGAVLNIKGKVKKHGEYKGVKENVLNYVKEL